MLWIGSRFLSHGKAHVTNQDFPAQAIEGAYFC